MLWNSGVFFRSGHCRNAPNVAKLLYGRRKNVSHTTSRAKPSVVAALMQAPDAELRRAVQRAAGLRELHHATVGQLLRKCRAANRLDRARTVVDAVDESGVGLTSSHYCTLIAHANDNRDWQSALHYWHRACREKKTNEKVHSALLATYRAASSWKEAVRHYNSMLEDKMTLDPYALHTVMNACRRANACDVALATFSKAVSLGASPNSTVYLELLRCMQQPHVHNRWRVSLGVLSSLEGKIDLTAGLFNATMATMGGARWRKGVQLFQTMKRKNVQPSKETLPTLVSLNPNNISHAVQCVAEAHTLGMPVTDGMYRAVLGNLIRLKLDHEAVRFAEREYRLCNANPGNPVNSSLALSLAIIDSLLAHNRPQEALLFFSVFESKFGSVVDLATRGLGIVGLRSQRWIVQGRVAVLDHNVLLNPRHESLLSHYDSILLPFSSVRLLVRRVKELLGTAKGRYTKCVLTRLRKLVADQKTPVRVLPLAHQLVAHTYIVDGTITKESMELLRSTVQEEKKEGEVRHKERQLNLLQEGDLPMPLLIRKKDTGIFGSGFVADVLEGNEEEVLKAGNGVLKENKAFVEKPNGAVLNNSERMSSPERVLAVAVMLKSLNPDADVHVVSTNTTQLQVTERWNRLRPLTTLTSVRFPEEVALKAPAEGQCPPKSSDTEEELTYKNMLRMRVLKHERKPFLDLS